MEVMEALKSTRTPARFKPQPVPDQVLAKVLGGARLASSVGNLQPWKFAVVTDEDLKRKIFGVCIELRAFADAPVLVVACARMDEAIGLVGGFTNSYPMDLGAAMTCMSLAATSEGLGTAWTHSFVEDKVKGLLNVPSGDHVLGVTPLGYPEEMAPPAGRKHLNEIMSYNKFE